MSLFSDDFPNRMLKNRLAFLTSRANSHIIELNNIPDYQDQYTLKKAFAATLYRDAACVSFILGKVHKARELLHKSGSLFLALGLPAGASFIALAGQHNAQEDISIYLDVIRGVRQQWRPKEAREREGAHRPVSDFARSEPRQLLSMMQADWIWEGRHSGLQTEDEGAPLRKALALNGGHPAGVTGLSIESYSAAADWLSRRYGIDDQLPDRVAASMSTMMAIREEQLRAARKDIFHWKMLARPAELIDLDATILMYLALEKNGTSKSGFEELIDPSRDTWPLLNAPAQIAIALRLDQLRERKDRL